MTRQPIPERQAAKSLLRALERPDDLACAEARAALPLLLEAERAGEDVDAQPEFAALLAHLDNCAACLELYAALFADVEALSGEVELPGVPGELPRVFVPHVKADNVVLRVLQGLRRRFELAITVPRAVPVSGSAAPSITLFADSLNEVEGAPEVEVILLRQTPPVLRVSISNPPLAARWLVRLLVAQQSYEAFTDTQGVAVLSGFSLEQLQAAPRLDISFGEQPAAENS